MDNKLEEGKLQLTECSFFVNQRVQCMLNRQKRYGTIRFIGNTEFSNGLWYGVELNEPYGKNDGSVAGVKYFDCKVYYGIFVTVKHIFPLDTDEEYLQATKPLRKRILPNVKETPARVSNLVNKTLPEVSHEEGIIETRPRSKSDNCFPNEHNTPLNVFNASPFKCDSTGKSLSHPKLNNTTYICNSPFYKDTDSPIPKYSTPLNEFLENSCKKTTSEETEQVSPKEEASVHHHVQLSPQLEVKQSIKLGSMPSSRIPSASKGKRSKYNFNKTFLIHKHSPASLSKDHLSAIPSNNIESSQNTNDVDKDKYVLENVNEVQASSSMKSRSLSKSSWSSMESISSVGSNKTEKSRLKSTSRLKESTGKTGGSSSTSKSKLTVKTTELKSRASTRDKSDSTKNKPTNGNKAGDNMSTLKSRTKSTSTVGNGLNSFGTPINKSAVTKLKSKSVSTHEDVIKTPYSTSKLPGSTRSSAIVPPRRLNSTSSRTTPSVSKKPTESLSARKTNDVINKRTASRSTSSVNTNIQRSSSQDGEMNERKINIKQAKGSKEKDEENKSCGVRTRIMSTPAAVTNDIKSTVSKNVRSTPRVSRATSVKTLKKIPETPYLKKKTASDDSIKRKESSNQKKVAEKKDNTLKKKDEINTYENNISKLTSALTPDILKQTPEITRQSVALQTNLDDPESQKSVELYQQEQLKVESLVSMLSQRNRDFTATLISLQHYFQKFEAEKENVSYLKKCVHFNKEKFMNAEKTIAKEASHRFRLEDEMLSIKSDSVVELAILRAEFERKQDMLRNKLLEDHKRSLEKVKKRNNKVIDELKQGCDLKLKRVEETYVQDISDINEKHKDEIVEIETEHSKVIQELIEERETEIETIKADYDEQMTDLNERLSESTTKNNKLAEKLKIIEEESKRDIESRIQEAIAKYKTLPAELESMKYVLEMKNGEIKKLRQNAAESRQMIEKLEEAKNRAASLEREKESLNFVVEHKVQFERQLSLERDKLRLSLDREVAASKRLSLENEELAWRLNTYQNSPSSPSFDRNSWKMSALNSPDSAIFSQRIEESDLESQIGHDKDNSS